MTLKKAIITVASLLTVPCLYVFLLNAFMNKEIAPHARNNFAVAATGASGTGTLNNHTLFGGNAPAISACGTTGAAIISWSTDNTGTVTVGSNPLNSGGQTVPQLRCTITFDVAFQAIPQVTAVSHFFGSQIIGVSRSTTAITINFNADMSAHTFTFNAF